MTMKLQGRSNTRRSIIVGAAAAALAWAGRPLARAIQAQQQSATIVAASVAQVPLEPEAPQWNQASAATISLNPQNIVLPRLREAGAKAINVRALYDPQRLGFLLEWQDAHKDVDLGTVLQYRDAVALQFPEELADPPPSFTMGQKGKGVVIYHWKSDWQYGPLLDVEEAYPNMHADWYPFSGVPAGVIPEATDYLTRGRKEYLTAAAVGNALADPQAQGKIGPVQKMRAEGYGTVEPDPTQDAKGKGVWRDGGWRIVISVPRQQSEFTFAEGMVVPLAFAVWDGSRSERNGQKAYSLWNTTSVGAPAELSGRRNVLTPLLAGTAGAIVVALAAFLGFRRWRTRQKDKV